MKDKWEEFDKALEEIGKYPPTNENWEKIDRALDIMEREIKKL